MSELQQLLDEIADAGESRGADAVFGVATERAVVRRRRRRDRRMLSGMALVVVALVVVGAIVRTAAKDNDTTTRVANPPAVGVDDAGTAARLAAGRWETLPAAPLAVRDWYAATWADKELFVWGGEGKAAGKGKAPMYNDGATYDPATRQWRLLPVSPLGPRSAAAAVWTGTEVVVWGGADGDATVADAAAYNPSTDSWRVLPPTPTVVSNYAVGAAVWTGDRVIVFAGATAAAYDPRTNRWQTLPPRPGHASPARLLAVAAGPGRVLLWSQWEVDTPTGPSSFTGTGGTDLLRYDEQSDGWTTLRPGPDAIVQPEEAFWTNGRALVRGDMHQPGALGPGPLPEVSAWYDPTTGLATQLSADAMTVGNVPAGNFSSAWTGRALVSWQADTRAGRIGPGDGSVYDPASNTWRRLPSTPFGCALGPVSLFWTGATVVMYCSDPYPAQPHAVGGLELIPGS